MQANDQDQDDFARLSFSPGQDRIQVPDQEHARDSRANQDKDPTKGIPRQDIQKGDGDPNGETISVESQYLYQVGLAAKVFGGAPDQGGSGKSIRVDDAKGKGQLMKVVDIGC